MNRIAMISSLTTRYEQTDEIVLSARLGVRHTCGVPMKIEQAKLTNKRGHSELAQDGQPLYMQDSWLLSVVAYANLEHFCLPGAGSYQYTQQVFFNFLDRTKNLPALGFGYPYLLIQSYSYTFTYLARGFFQISNECAGFVQISDTQSFIYSAQSYSYILPIWTYVYYLRDINNGVNQGMSLIDYWHTIDKFKYQPGLLL